MSAGTVLVIYGDKIHMDYFSILSPIDPQVGDTIGKQIPALGYLIQYKKLIDKAENGSLNTSEITVLIEEFDQAVLYRYEKARELSINLLTEWLVNYKFKDWRKTQDKGQKITDQLRRARATAIAKKLSDPDIWHSHSRGISMEVLRQDIKLKIDDFEKNSELNQELRVYCKFLRDYIRCLRHAGVLHRRENYVPLRRWSR